jgi:hypothetical protein
MQSTLGNAAAGSDSGFAFVGGGENTVATGATMYSGTMARAFSGSIGYVVWAVPSTCTVRNLRVRTLTAQPGTGTMVVVVRDDTTSTDTALTVTIGAGAAAGLFSDTSNSASVTGGDHLVLKITNNATETSGGIQGWGFQCN